MSSRRWESKTQSNFKKIASYEAHFGLIEYDEAHADCRVKEETLNQQIISITNDFNNVSNERNQLQRQVNSLQSQIQNLSSNVSVRVLFE
jgi:SMC interacting uncharacterized protein involved in chromosome segregation